MLLLAALACLLPSIAFALSFPLQCEATVFHPPQFATKTEHVILKPAYSELQFVPSVLETAIKRVQVRPPEYQQWTQKPVYEQVTEDITVFPEQLELAVSPAIFTRARATVVIKPTHKVWANDCVIHQSDHCITQRPAQKKSYLQQDLKQPASIRQATKPARTKRVTRWKLIKPGKGIGPVLPAKYVDIQTYRVAKPWHIKRIEHPAVTNPVTVEFKTQEPLVVKHRSLCKNSATPERIAAIQNALSKAGFPTAVTKRLDARTYRSVLNFQRQNNLPLGGITAPTLKKLGLL